jgi:nanoRNase/pAp phosphatase (c-di-AMP/oligoRNAs hydrolase)
MVSETTRKRFEELARLVGESSGRWLVLTHDNPDPDALASAALLARLLRDGFGRKVTAAYSGLIGRAENQEMVKSLHLRLSHLRHLKFSRYTRFALVDAQPRTGNHQLPAEVTPDLVFDHHPLRKATQAARFHDVRIDYGATVTILAEYLEACGLTPSRREATALVYAIRAETQDFGREFAPVDKAIYDAYLPQVDKRALGKIQNARLPLSYFRILHDALENLEEVGTLVVSHLQEVEQPDIVPELADLLLRIDGKTWCLVTGRFADRVYLSIRTTNPRAEAGQIMRRLVGRNGKGGGHGMTAGGWVKVTIGYAANPRSLQAQLGKRLAKALKKNPDKLAPIELKPPPPTPPAEGG